MKHEQRHRSSKPIRLVHEPLVLDEVELVEKFSALGRLRNESLGLLDVSGDDLTDVYAKLFPRQD